MEANIITIKLTEPLDLDLKLDHHEFKKHLVAGIVEMLNIYGVEDDYNITHEEEGQNIKLSVNNIKIEPYHTM